MRETKPDLLSIKLRIYGYSDCVGAEKDNKELRRRRAEQAYELLDKDLQKRVEFAIAAPAGEYVVDNKTRQGRATNRESSSS
jgi:outer membrane protein OmpA-like peptidoglycan-associated protein